MSPIRSNIFYALFFIAFLLWPFYQHIFPLLSRPEKINTAPVNKAANYRFLYRQLYEKKEPIDVLFFGSSALTASINTEYIESEIRKRQRRPVSVITLGFSWKGFDLAYLQLQTLLQQRKVRLLVLSLQMLNKKPHPRIHDVWIPQDNKHIRPLPLRYKAGFLITQSLNSLQDLVKARLPHSGKFAPYTRDSYFFYQSSTHGDFKARWGFMGEPFTLFDPTPPIVAASEIINQNWVFIDQALNPKSLLFIKKIEELAFGEGTQLAWIQTTLHRMRNSGSHFVNRYFESSMQKGTPLIGITGKQLFAGLTEEEIKLLYYSDPHFNRNGNLFFTTVITPTIIHLYENYRHNH